MGACLDGSSGPCQGRDVTRPALADYRSRIPAQLRRETSDPERTSWTWGGCRVSVLRRRAPEAPVRLVLIHGAGGHAAALWPVAELVPEHLAELVAPDLPLYGDTECGDPAAVRYGDWVRLLVDFLAAEDDGRPVVLLGASIGGMLAYEAAARSGAASAAVATCLLDPRSPAVQRVMTRFGPFGMLAGPLARLAPARLERAMIPVGWVAALGGMNRDPELVRLCRRDPRGGAAKVPIGFLTSFLRYRHVPPERMATEVTLAHPARDAWTPVRVSLPWFSRLSRPGPIVLLPECGHFPVEEPGLSRLIATLAEVCERTAAPGRAP